MNITMVSVLMTAYNREKYIAEAIESVLASSYSNFELIIVDDCSTDGTVEIARKYIEKDNRIKLYINETNLGDYPNRNRIAKLAKAKFITYVDSDDIIYPYTLRKMVDASIQFPDAALYISVRSIDEEPETYQYLSPKQAYDFHFKKCGFLETGPLGILINKEIFDLVGGFSGKRMIGDTELWLKIAKKFSVVRLHKNLVFWRQHPEQEYRVGRKFYLIDSLQMYKDVLVNDISPLGLEEGIKFYKKLKMQRYLILFKDLIKNWRIKEFYNYFKLIYKLS